MIENSMKLKNVAHLLFFDEKKNYFDCFFFGYEILARLKKFREIKNRANFFKETPPNCSAPNNRKTKFQ